LSVNLPPSGPETQAALARVVVSDAGPLIALGRLNLLVLLSTQFTEVQVSQQVLKECTARPGNDDVARIVQALADGWLKPCEAVPVAAPALGLGERAAIARALEIRAGLLADDQDARQHAKALGLQTVGTLGVLVIAKRTGAIASLRPLISS
jgi:uncharacterized protein